MAGSVPHPTIPASAAPFARTIPARSICLPPGSVCGLGSSARHRQMLLEMSLRSITEQGIAAWYFLLSNRYGFGKAGQFDLASVARRYAGQNATAAEVKAYTDGWSKWSNGALKPETVVHFAIDEELLDFAKATFAHEAGAVSPLHDDQILYGFALERQTT